MSEEKLLESEGDISSEVNLPIDRIISLELNVPDQLESCLKHIFAKYCTPLVVAGKDMGDLLVPHSEAYLSPQGLDKWALDTNGEVFTADMKEEIKESLDTTEDGNLTYVKIILLKTRLTDSYS